VNTLAPKLVLTPLLVASTSIAGRRWGPALSGWLVALPLTSGPIAFFIALEGGARVARDMAGGSLVGAVAQVAFAAAYVVASRRVGWVPSLFLASAAFFCIGFAYPTVAAPITYATLVLVAGLFVWTSRHPAPEEADPLAHPAWDIPARVIVATALVVGISSLAAVLGGHVSGVLATFPVYASVLTTFAHVTRGRVEAVDVLRGLAAGLPGFGAFFLTLHAMLGAVGLGESFGLAIVVGLTAQAATFPIAKVVSR
jgi:hypothetical protein